MSTHHAPGRITVSIVSHGHDLSLARLLDELRRDRHGLIDRVVLTHNRSPRPPRPAIALAGAPWTLVEIEPAVPLGFAANHNRAFAHCETAYFAVLNPDLHGLSSDFWPQLLRAAQRAGAGCAYPRLLNADGSVQDNEREWVTPLSLLKRHVLRQRETRVDWVSGACWLVPAAVWRELGGLDEGYRMYCEDTDWCLRLRHAGRTLEPADASALHDAARSSRRAGQAMLWHLGSLARLWTRPHWWRRLAWRAA